MLNAVQLVCNVGPSNVHLRKLQILAEQKWHPIQQSPSHTDELVTENVIHLTSSAAILTT